MNSLNGLNKLIDAAVNEDCGSLKVKMLEDRVRDLEDIVEDMYYDFYDSSEEDDKKTQIIITGTQVPKKKTTTKSKRSKK